MVKPHQYVRVDERIYELMRDDKGHVVGRSLIKKHDSISQAKKWVRAQEAKEPGSVRVEEGDRKPVITTTTARTYTDFVRAEARETGERNRRLSRSVPDRLEPRIPRVYVAPDDTGNYLRSRRRGLRGGRGA